MGLRKFTVALVLWAGGMVACAAPSLYNPGDPATEEYYIFRFLDCALGKAGCGGAAGNASVSGVMSGLSGSVTATLNGTETITIGADGVFSFASQMNPGDSYTVTVDTMPVPQVCFASNATGTFPDTGAVQVSIDCKSVIYVAGDFASYKGTASAKIVRIETSGALDSTFNVGTGLTGAAGKVRGLLVAPDGSGKVYVAGNFTAYNGTPANRIVRLNVDGSMDTTFNYGSGFDNEVWSLAAAPDGSGDIYAVGNFTTYNGAGSVRIVRINSDGSRNTGFAVGSGLTALAARDVIATADGSNDVYVVGDFVNYAGTPYNYLVRLNADGSHDGTFSLGAGFASGNAHYAALAADGSGDLYVAGTFTQYQGTTQGRITRINADGTRDAGFNISPGCDFAVDAVAVANDGSGDVYVAGAFSNCNGAGNTSGMARFNSDGSIDAGFPVSGTSDINYIRAAPGGDGDVYIVGNTLVFNGAGVFRLFRANADATVDAGFNTGASGLNNRGFVIAP